MKKFRFLILILTMATTGNAQDIFGKWYGINDDGLTELDISVDTLKGQVLKTGENKGFERTNIKHSGIFNIKDKTIIVFADNKSSSTTTYRALTFFNIKDKVSMEIAANGITTATNTIDELVNLSKSHKEELFGNIIFSKGYLVVLGRLKDIELMTLDEFKLFLKNYVDKIKQIRDREQLMPGTFQNQLITRNLIEIGFNPMNRKDWFDRFLEKYLADKEVEELWRKM
jgi:hypothetical protein